MVPEEPTNQSVIEYLCVINNVVKLYCFEKRIYEEVNTTCVKLNIFEFLNINVHHVMLDPDNLLSTGHLDIHFKTESTVGFGSTSTLTDLRRVWLQC
jgi:hypothetical protein